MPELLFQTFPEANATARIVSSRLNLAAVVERTTVGFMLKTNDSAAPSKVADLANGWGRYLTLEEQKRVIYFVQGEHWANTAHAWQDDETGLVWDIARLICGTGYNEYPRSGNELMNELLYGGRDDWRLPTVTELQTLTLSKLLGAGASLGDFIKIGTNLWSCETDPPKRVANGVAPDYLLVDIETKRTAVQYYREGHPDRVTSHDGYREYAQTLFVAGVSHYQV